MQINQPSYGLMSFQNRAASLNNVLTKVSTGLAINRAADNPAGLIISEQLGSEMRQVDAEIRRAERSTFVAATADAHLAELSSSMGRAREIAVSMAGDPFMSDETRALYRSELDSLVSSMDRSVGSATFNGTRLYDGEQSLGDGETAVELDMSSVSALGETDIDGSTYTMSDLSSLDGESMVAVLDQAMSDVLTQRAALGAYEPSAQAMMNVKQVEAENLAAARSAVRDADYAEESSSLVRDQILLKASAMAQDIQKSSASQVLNLLA